MENASENQHEPVHPLIAIALEAKRTDRNVTFKAEAPFIDPGAEVELPNDNRPITLVAIDVARNLASRRPNFFNHGGELVQMQHGELSPVESKTFRTDLEQVTKFYRVNASGQRETQATCPANLAGDILACRAFYDALPSLNRIAQCPVLLERNGRIITVEGYDRESGIYARGGEIPDMSWREASILLNGILKDTKFASPGDKARALAGFITPAFVMGAWFDNRAPVDFSEADASQAGKGFRNKKTAAIYNDEVHIVTQKKGGVGSSEEHFSKLLQDGRFFISWDNFRGQMDEPGLESFLTEEYFPSRTAHGRNVEIRTRDHYIMYTSNNITFSPDFGNRCCAVRILYQPDKVWTKYEGGVDVLGHLKANQPKYLGAVFAIIKEWHRQGKQRTNETRHKRQEWCQILDWIVQNLLGSQVPLMEGHEAIVKRLRSPHEAWLRQVCLEIQNQNLLDKTLSATQLVGVIEQNPTIDMPGGSDSTQQAKQIGIRLSTSGIFGSRDGVGLDDKHPLQTGEIEVENFTFTRQSTLNPNNREKARHKYVVTAREVVPTVGVESLPKNSPSPPPPPPPPPPIP